MCFAYGEELLVFFLEGVLGKGDAVENEALEKLKRLDTRKGYFTELVKESDIQDIL